MAHRGGNKCLSGSERHKGVKGEQMFDCTEAWSRKQQQYQHACCAGPQLFPSLHARHSTKFLRCGSQLRYNSFFAFMNRMITLICPRLFTCHGSPHRMLLGNVDYACTATMKCAHAPVVGAVNRCIRLRKSCCIYNSSYGSLSTGSCQINFPYVSLSHTSTSSTNTICLEPYVR